MIVQQIISKWPQKVLAFLGSEEFFDDSLAPRRKKTGCTYSKEEEEAIRTAPSTQQRSLRNQGLTSARIVIPFKNRSPESSVPEPLVTPSDLGLSSRPDDEASSHRSLSASPSEVASITRVYSPLSRPRLSPIAACPSQVCEIHLQASADTCGQS